ncbi:GAF domain-containing protein [Symplocastrum sp. BBK-W-15]|uniref:GAF domain-containing protein n=2 Tax=Limnofasciculus TaxID=3064905 RepID=A0AAE3KMC4_9CYAN|nr:GAF domain-containing protein [Limnofasciculus baicalensis BBK-W-15]
MNLNSAIIKICESTDWHYGEVWLPEEDDTILNLSDFRCISPQNSSERLAWEQFWECSKEFILSPGEGLPGRVWVSQKPEWISDVSVESETYFLRNKIAQAFGVKTALGIPIIANHRVESVLVFFMLESRSRDENIIKLVFTIITNQLSQD